MSYDLTLYRPENLTSDFPVPKEKLVAALQVFDSTLEVSSFDPAALAKLAPEMPAVLQEFARTLKDRVSLEGTYGIQIAISKSSASITVPYLHDSIATHAAFEKLWDYLRILVRDGGLLVHDPQLGRNLDLMVDLPNVLLKYDEGNAKLRNV